jgi:hypothetical protein
MRKTTLAGALALAALAVPPPVAAQGTTVTPQSIDKGPWQDIGQSADGLVVALSPYRATFGTVIELGLRTTRAGEPPSYVINIVDIDCAFQRLRTVASASRQGGGELVAQAPPGDDKPLRPDSFMGKLAEGLCPAVMGPPPTPADRDAAAFLVGKWRAGASTCDGNWYQFAADGTYREQHGVLAVGGQRMEASEGRWDVSQGRLRTMQPGQAIASTPLTRRAPDETEMFAIAYKRCP